jgi:hypothetical protein
VYPNFSNYYSGVGTSKFYDYLTVLSVFLFFLNDLILYFIKMPINTAAYSYYSTNYVPGYVGYATSPYVGGGYGGGYGGYGSGYSVTYY